MNEIASNECERQIHALIHGDLDESDRFEVLQRLSEDQATRRLLAEMLLFQRDVRAAFGYDQADETIPSNVAHLVSSSRQQEQGSASNTGRWGYYLYQAGC